MALGGERKLATVEGSGEPFGYEASVGNRANSTHRDAPGSPSPTAKSPRTTEQPPAAQTQEPTSISSTPQIPDGLHSMRSC